MANQYIIYTMYNWAPIQCTLGTALVEHGFQNKLYSVCNCPIAHLYFCYGCGWPCQQYVLRGEVSWPRICLSLYDRNDSVK